MHFVEMQYVKSSRICMVLLFALPICLYFRFFVTVKFHLSAGSSKPESGVTRVELYKVNGL